jgi:hypothetical protein
MKACRHRRRVVRRQVVDDEDFTLTATRLENGTKLRTKSLLGIPRSNNYASV